VVWRRFVEWDRRSRWRRYVVRLAVERPVQYVITAGAIWGVFFWAAFGPRTRLGLVNDLLFGWVLVGPLFLWTIRRRM
jgi:hypothetical protein